MCHGFSIARQTIERESERERERERERSYVWQNNPALNESLGDKLVDMLSCFCGRGGSRVVQYGGGVNSVIIIIFAITLNEIM